jgi:hypothetical protein
MDTRGLIILVILLILASQASAETGITNVSISPASPGVTDQISILVSGLEGSGGVLITDTDFSVIGNTLSLDIYLYLGPSDVGTPWSYTETVGTLSEGTYNLTVQRFLPSYYPPPIVDSYSMSFGVTPEPATIVLLGVGAILARKKSVR